MVFRSWVTDFEARVVAVDTQILIRPIWLEFNRGYKGVRSRWSLFVRDSRGFRRDREHLFIYQHPRHHPLLFGFTSRT